MNRPLFIDPSSGAETGSPSGSLTLTIMRSPRSRSTRRLPGAVAAIAHRTKFDGALQSTLTEPGRMATATCWAERLFLNALGAIRICMLSAAVSLSEHGNRR